MKGYVGKLLYIDLTHEQVRVEYLNEEYARLFLGGRGLGDRYIYDYLYSKGENIGPFDEDNVLIIMTGPLTGSPLPSVHRFVVVSKSPLTGTRFSSCVGGTFGVELKMAGYDGLIIKGRAEKPTYIWINDDHIEFRNAVHLWGKFTDEVRMLIKKEVKDEKAKVMRIGPAGEKLVRFACIMSEPDRSAGRGGGGAVMGSKNLKAIAVRGSKKIEVADEVGCKKFAKDLIKQLLTLKDFIRFGSMFYTELIADVYKAYPYKNYTGILTSTEGKVDSKTFRDKFVIREASSCYICPIPCGKLSEVKEGLFKGAKVEGPEYETCWAFGSNCGILDLAPIIAANEIADKYGMDTISAGSAISFAMECYERGIISYDEVDVDLKFGNAKAAAEMLKEIGERRGLGNILAEGVKRAAEKIGKGAEHYAMHVKGLELPAYDPRAMYGIGLTYGISTRGGDHTYGTTARYELFSGKMIPTSIEGKAKMVIERNDSKAIDDSLLICAWLTRVITHKIATEMLRLTTGWEFNEEELLKCGERIYNLERVMNVIDGYSRKDDYLPSRILEEAVIIGPFEKKLKRSDYERMLDEYYSLRGWNHDGIPLEDNLKRLNLEFAINRLRGVLL